MAYLLILVLGGIASLFGPWWVIAPVCFAVSWWKCKKGGQAFGISALAVVTLWLGYSFYLHSAASVDFSARVAGIFTGSIPALQNAPGIAVVLVIAGLVSGLVGGFSGLAGVQIRKFFKA